MGSKTSVQHVGICGIGQMGAAAAVSFRRAGYRVLLWARNPDRLKAVGSTLARLDAWLDENVGPATVEGGDIVRIENLQQMDRDAELIMDCIAEDMGQKVELFRSFTAAQERGSIFITTTSGLSITEMGKQSGHASHLVGTHFWNPPHLIPLVEVIRTEETDETVVDTVCEVVRALGKTPVKVERDVPGFIGNRLLHALFREAISLVERGIASAEDVDLVARYTFGLRLPVLGPLENMDLVGLDLIETIHKYLLADLADNRGPSKLLSGMVNNKELGMKGDQGFFDWRSRDKNAVIERRDKQIVQQLKYLREIDKLRRTE